MPTPITFEPQTAKRELTITRVFKAPRAKVWDAWTNPEILKQWWAPAPWKVADLQLELKPGGVWRYAMEGPDGSKGYSQAVYREIDAPQRLVYTDAFSDAEGNINPDLPEMLITATFDELEDGSTRVMWVTKFAKPEDLDKIMEMGFREGVTQACEQLDQLFAQEA
jgi:uncharacterized protein YndB with AHSA1/START domain